ncbi:hypothetical protein MMC27_004448 [Xylographa pallens]|nr:hypothetical protein [Xylographa pallens]
MSHSETGLLDGRINDQIPGLPANADEDETANADVEIFVDEREGSEETDEAELRVKGLREAGLEVKEEEADADSTEETVKEDMVGVEAIADEVADIVETPRTAEEESIGTEVDTELR